MSVLEQLIQNKRQDELLRRQQATSLGDNFLKGLMMREKMKQSPYDQLIKRAQLAEAAKTLGDEQLFNTVTGKTQNPVQANPSSKVVQPVGSQLDQQTQSSDKATEESSKLEPKGFDVFGNPTGFQLKKATAAEDKRNVENDQLSGGIQSLVSAFDRAKSQRDAVDVPFFDSLGIPDGTKQKIKGKFVSSLAGFGADNTGDVDAYNRMRKAFATTVAKAAGEVRPTDEDIQRFMKTLPSVDNPDATNQRLIEELQNNLRSRGARAVFEEAVGRSVGEASKKASKFKVEVLDA